MGKTNLGRVTFVPRGTYSNETAYKRLDVVEYEGSSYLFLKDSTGVVPIGDNVVTMFLAKKGKDFAYEDFTPEQLATLKGADGKDGADGMKGDKGDTGKGLTILGYYGTLDLLKAGVTTPEPGDAYGIGTAAPYDIYVFDGVTNDWVNNGKLSGGGESGGNVVLIPGEVVNLTNTSTSVDILTIFGGKEAFIDAVTRVKNGALLALDVNGALSPVQFSFGSFLQEQDIYQLSFIYVNAIDWHANFMITILLSGDVAAIEKSNHHLGYANIVSIPSDVMSLSNESTSEQIITAFGGKPAFDAIIEKVRIGSAIAIMTATSSDSAGSVPCTTVVYDYVDYSNLKMQLIISIEGDTATLNITVANSVVSMQKQVLSALKSSDLVSDPSVGGTDKPASAEAVKTVYDLKQEQIKVWDITNHRGNSGTLSSEELEFIKQWIKQPISPISFRKKDKTYRYNANINGYNSIGVSITAGYVHGGGGVGFYYIHPICDFNIDFNTGNFNCDDNATDVEFALALCLPDNQALVGDGTYKQLI